MTTFDFPMYFPVFSLAIAAWLLVTLRPWRCISENAAGQVLRRLFLVNIKPCSSLAIITAHWLELQPHYRLQFHSMIATVHLRVSNPLVITWHVRLRTMTFAFFRSAAQQSSLAQQSSWQEVPLSFYLTFVTHQCFVITTTTAMKIGLNKNSPNRFE